MLYVHCRNHQQITDDDMYTDTYYSSRNNIYPFVKSFNLRTS